MDELHAADSDYPDVVRVCSNCSTNTTDCVAYENSGCGIDTTVCNINF